MMISVASKKTPLKKGGRAPIAKELSAPFTKNRAVPIRPKGFSKIDLSLTRSPFLINFSKFIRASRRRPLLPLFYRSRHLNLNSAMFQFLFNREILGRSFIFPSEREFFKKSKAIQNAFLFTSKPNYFDNSFYEEEEISLPPSDHLELDPTGLLENGESGDTPESSRSSVAGAEKEGVKGKPKISVFDRFDYLSSAFVSILCRRGLKLKAERILEDTLRNLGESLKSRFKKFQSVSTSVFSFVIRFFFLNAIENTKPLLSLKKQVVAGVIRSSPIVTSEQKRLLVAIRWIVAAAKVRSEIPFAKALSAELLDAFFSKGKAISKRSELHSVVISSRAFLRLKNEKGSWFSKERPSVSGFRMGLRLLLRKRLRYKFKQLLSKVYSPKPVWKLVRFGDSSYKRVVFEKPSKKELISRLKTFLFTFNAMTLDQKVAFLLGFERFVYIYRSKFYRPLSGFIKEYIISISGISTDTIPDPAPGFSSRSEPAWLSAVEAARESENFFPEFFDIYRKLPFLISSFPSSDPRPPHRPFRPRFHLPSLYYGSIFTRCVFNRSRVTVMYRRERDPRYAFLYSRRFNQNKFNNFRSPSFSKTATVRKKGKEKSTYSKNNGFVRPNYPRSVPFPRR